MEKIQNLLKSEPLRARLYAIIVVIAGYLLARGYIAATDADFIGALAVLVLGVESARARVTPDAKNAADE